jgi:predicted Kef-type K+ transport protein
MEFIWILFAFLGGLSARLVKMPPLIGFLLAGFILHYFGFKAHPSLETFADLGITLMLFTIGLKLNVRDLLKTEVWATTLSHMAVWTTVMITLCIVLGALALPYFTDLTLTQAALVAFACSFSSTVCIVKLLEENGEMRTRHGKLAIGVLVLQDIVAVIFLVGATGKMPSLWALVLLGLPLAQKLLHRLIEHAGHGELLPLTGFCMALGGYELFELVGVKGDLGALCLGALLAPSFKSEELAKSLLNFKDLFLIGFFLSIGFTALPTLDMLGISLVLAPLLVLKFCLFFVIFSGCKLRGRSAYLSGMLLSNFSEFGLIVVAISVEGGLLPKEWLVIIALSVSLSFVLTNIIYRSAHTVYMNHKGLIRRFERQEWLAEDKLVQPKNAEILVIGLGSTGLGAYHALYDILGVRVWGMDSDPELIQKLWSQNLHVFVGDGENADFWENINIHSVKLILLSMPSIEDCRNISVQLTNAGYAGQLAAIARYEDERAALQASGINKVFNFYTEAGLGFARESLELIDIHYPVTTLPETKNIELKSELV